MYQIRILFNIGRGWQIRRDSEINFLSTFIYRVPGKEGRGFKIYILTQYNWRVSHKFWGRLIYIAECPHKPSKRDMNKVLL